MKFRKFGHAMLAAVVSAGMVLGLTSCTSSFTVAYFYVIGQQYNQISGYKVDNNTGKLTQIANLPIGTGGTMPIQNLILPAGRFLYVLNQGSDGSNGAGVVRFVVGGTGILTQQDGLTPSQGTTPLRMAVDNSGSFLYVLDRVAQSPVNCPPPPTGVVPPTTCSDISVFKIDPNTGRLTPVVNQQLINPATGANLTYFPVPGNAVDMALVGTTVYVATDDVSSADNKTPVEQVTAFTSTSGQLTTTSTGTQSVSAYHINRLVGGYTSSNAIGAASTYIYILDRGAPASDTGFFTQSQVLTYTPGTGGALGTVSGGTITQVGTVNNPNFLLTENSKKVVYVSNGGDAPDSSTTNGAGYITAYLITVASGQGAGQLTVQPDSPFTTEAGPRCIIEDPSNQYIYSIDHDANNITLRRLDTTHYNLTTPRAAGSYATVNQPVWGVMTNRTQ